MVGQPGDVAAGPALRAELPARLETPRLRLRRLTTDDADFIVVLLNQPAFLRFIGDKGVRSPADACRYIQDGPLQSYRRFGFGLYLVELSEGATPIGICGLLKRDALPDPDLGFALLERFWSGGYAFEAASRILHEARATLGLRRIVAITTRDNAASMRLLGKLGFSFERLARLDPAGPELSLFAWQA